MLECAVEFIEICVSACVYNIIRMCVLYLNKVCCTHSNLRVQIKTDLTADYIH